MIQGDLAQGHQLLNVDELLSKVILLAGGRVADFGTGRLGFLAFPAARVVGESGIVYAVDILKEVLDEVNKRAEREGLVNLHTVWSDLEKVGAASIPEASLNAVFLINILIQIDDRMSVLKEAWRLLRAGGRVLVVDWTTQDTPLAPKSRPLIDFFLLEKSAREIGFMIVEDFSAGAYHRGFVLYKP